MSTPLHPRRTLFLAAVLHGFTHIYHVALMPLYFLIQADLRLASVAQATLLLTVQMAAYFLPSYVLGALADRFNRKRLLVVGMTINALGFVGLALAPSFPLALACSAVAGFGGSFFHPSATALVAGLFPVRTGRALGLLGIGASFGFFIGPWYSGWQAERSGWRTAILVIGLAGLAVAALFAWLAESPGARPAGAEPAATTPAVAVPVRRLGLWRVLALTAFAFGLRDFAGSCMATLTSLFLQKARAFDPSAAGFAVSTIFVASALSNPLFGHLSDRRRGLTAAAVLVVAAGLIAVFPLARGAALWTVLLAFGFFFMASYPITEAALMEGVPDALRGRAFGLFITVGGLIANTAHWVAGAWVRALGDRAADPATYRPAYTVLAVLVLLSLLGLPGLKSLRTAADRRRVREDVAERT